MARLWPSTSQCRCFWDRPRQGDRQRDKPVSRSAKDRFQGDITSDVSKEMTTTVWRGPLYRRWIVMSCHGNFQTQATQNKRHLAHFTAWLGDRWRRSFPSIGNRKGWFFQGLEKFDEPVSNAWKMRLALFPRSRAHITSAPPKEDGYTYRMLKQTTTHRRPVHAARVYAVD